MQAPGYDCDVSTWVVREPRRVISLRTRLIGFGGLDTEVWLQNVSSRGLSGVSAQPLMIGSTILVDLGSIGGVAVRVRWALGTRFGASFERAFVLSPAQLDQITQLAPA